MSLRKEINKLIKKLTCFQISYIEPYWKHEELSLFAQDNLVVDIESIFMKRLGLQGTCIATSSGRTALELGLRVLKQKNVNKDEVITPTYGCRGVFDPIIKAQLIPVLADNDKNLLISFDTILPLISDRTLAIIVPHLGGRFCSDIIKINEYAKIKGIVVIEDVCQAVGTKVGKDYLGNMTDMSFFSFSIGKNLMSTSGGMLVSKIFADDIMLEAKNLQPNDDESFFERFNYMKQYYFAKSSYSKYIFPEIAFSGIYEYKMMHPYDKLLLSYQLGKIDIITNNRIKNAKILCNELKDISSLKVVTGDKENGWLKFSIILESKNLFDYFIANMPSSGIELEGMYTPLHKREFASIYQRGDYDTVDNLYDKIINIPVKPQLNKRQIKYIGKCINLIINRYGEYHNGKY